MQTYNINDLTCFQWFLYIIICIKDNEINQFDYIDFYPKIRFNKEEFIESIKECDNETILDINISYRLYRNDLMITKKLSKEVPMPIRAGESLLEKINEYLAMENQINVVNLLSTDELLKQITKAYFLLSCFQYNDRYQIF